MKVTRHGNNSPTSWIHLSYPKKPGNSHLLFPGFYTMPTALPHSIFQPVRGNAKDTLIRIAICTLPMCALLDMHNKGYVIIPQTIMVDV